MTMEPFGEKAPTDNKVGASAAYQASKSMVVLADEFVDTGEVAVYAVLPAKRTFQIYNPGGGTVRVDVTNDPDLGWNNNYISTTSDLDFYSEDMPWHYVRVYVESQGSPSGVTVKMGV